MRYKSSVEKGMIHCILRLAMLGIWTSVESTWQKIESIIKDDMDMW